MASGGGKYWEESTEFWPKAFTCIDCDCKTSVSEDGFLGECCSKGIVCNRCFGNGGKRRVCKYCGENARYIRVKSSFFKGVQEDAKEWKERADGQKNGVQLREGGMLAMIKEKELSDWNPRLGQIIDIIGQIMRNHRHAKGCRPYTNLNYLGEMFFKLSKTRGTGITIHDLLAFVCCFCGHGPMNVIELPTGEVRRLGFHSMMGCARECCAVFLDRRYLQFGGDCECGVLIMEQLGVRMATEEENKWRRELFMGKGGGVLNMEVRKKLGPCFLSLGIRKPQLLVWFIMSQGGAYLEGLMGMEEEARIARVGELRTKLNNEFGRQVPIQ